MDLRRRSSRNAGDRVTAAGNPTSSSAVQTSTTYSKKTTLTSIMASIKKTRSKTPSVKRKGEAEKFDRKSKKSRMGEEPTSEELHALGEEITLLLHPVISQVDTIIKAFPKYKTEEWFETLQTLRQLIPTLIDKVKSREELSERPELRPIEREGKPFGLPNVDRDLVEENLKDLEACFKKVINQCKEEELPAPSTYCLGSQYRRYQFDSRTAVRDGRVGTIPIALELLHSSFRIFTYWSFQNPYPLPGSPAYSQETRPIDEDVFINTYRAANELLLSMPQLYTSHDDRLHDFRTALLLIFPQNEEYEWLSNSPVGSSLGRVDLLYQYKNPKGPPIPLIFVEIKLELGEGGNPFWQNHRLYQSYTKKNLQSRRNGAPVFFVQLCGTHLGIAGGFYDSADESMSPVVLQLGGYVNLQYDYVGRNLRETVTTLWALRQAINHIPCEWEDIETRHKLMNVPRYGPESGVEIIDVLHAGVVYLAKPVDDGTQFALNQENKLVLKIIYSGIAFERYGKRVHQYLESKDFAPKYHFCLEIGNILPTRDVIEQHHFMEYLSPPSDDSAGWISLLELEVKFPEVACTHKSDIKEALYQIINVLREGNYVHGDLRPNNLFIKVTIAPDGCTILNRDTSPLPYLKVIDFDWAGEVGAVKYPPHRNPDVEWPGYSGKPILADHDKSMIDSWLSKWPPADAKGDSKGDKATSVLGDSHTRGDQARFIRVSVPSM